MQINNEPMLKGYGNFNLEWIKEIEEIKVMKSQEIQIKERIRAFFMVTGGLVALLALLAILSILIG